ncbi:MAG: hypothetical protein ACE5Z5_11165 [Candidatus Bathyarchaeia archaeon]
MCSFDGGDRTDHYLWQVARGDKPTFTPKETRMKIIQLAMKSDLMTMEETEGEFHIIIYKDKSNEQLWKRTG